MGTLVIDRKGIVARIDGDAIAFYSGDTKEGITPIKPLKRVIVCGSVLIDSALLGRLSEENISVIFLSGKRQRFRGVLHGRLHNNGLLRLRQYEKAMSAFAGAFAKETVIKKLAAQAEFLKEAFDRRPDRRNECTKGMMALKAVLESARGTDEAETERLRGLEGGAAAAYFSAYVSLFPDSLGFKKRERRPPGDPVNAFLSLSYTLLHWEAVCAIETAGLDPTIGFYHKFEYGRESLACDLIEPLRPAVDKWVWRLFADRTFSSGDFTSGEERPGCYLNKEGRRRFYRFHEEWSGAVRGAVTDTVRTLAAKIVGEGDAEDALHK